MKSSLKWRYKAVGYISLGTEFFAALWSELWNVLLECNGKWWLISCAIIHKPDLLYELSVLAASVAYDS